MIVLTGCSDDQEPEPAGLLTTADVGDVQSSKPFDRNGTGSTGCVALGGVESNLDATRPETIGRWFSLPGRTRVISTVLGIYRGESSTDYTIRRVDDAVKSCSSSATGQFKRLDELPDDAVGFRSVLDGSQGAVTTERAAPVGDDRIVVVTVEHTDDHGSGPPRRTPTSSVAGRPRIGTDIRDDQENA